MFSLTVYRGDKLVQELDFDTTEVNIGRKPENAVVLPDDGKGVSRIHAILRVEDGEFVLHDGNSRNGTFVDGKPIKRVVIYPGQDFVVGPYRLVLGASDAAESAPTMVATRISAPPPVPPPPGEGTHSKSSEGSTRSRLPAHGAGSPAAAKAPGSQPLPVAYLAAGGAVILILGAFLIWQLMPDSEQPETTTTLVPSSTTSIPEPTTTIPEAPPPDPHADQIAEAQAAMEAAETTFAAKNYRAAAREFERVIRDRLSPILSADAAYAPAIELEARAKTRAAEALKLAPPLPPPPPEPIRPGPNDVAVRDGENRDDYDRRNKEAIQDYELGRRYFSDGDFLAASKLFADLTAREPGWRDVSTYARNAQESLDKERQRALNEGIQFENAGFKSYNAKNLAAAANEYATARKAFERAAALQAPQAQKLLAENLERRRFVARAALDQARTHVNFRNRGEARKWFQLAIDLLPAGEPIRKEAESDLQKLSPSL